MIKSKYKLWGYIFTINVQIYPQCRNHIYKRAVFKAFPQIENESNDRCREITENANKKAEEIIGKAQADAQELVSLRKTQADKRNDDIIIL